MAMRGSSAAAGANDGGGKREGIDSVIRRECSTLPLWPRTPARPPFARSLDTERGGWKRRRCTRSYTSRCFGLIIFERASFRVTRLNLESHPFLNAMTDENDVVIHDKGKFLSDVTAANRSLNAYLSNIPPGDIFDNERQFGKTLRIVRGPAGTRSRCPPCGETRDIRDSF